MLTFITTLFTALTSCLRPDTVTSFGIIVYDLSATSSENLPIGKISTGIFRSAYSSTLIVIVSGSTPTRLIPAGGVNPIVTLF